MTVGDLIAKYKPLWEKMSEREKGLAEKEIWEACDYVVRKGWSRREYLSTHISGTEAQVQVRETLINTGDAAEPLWQRIEAGTMVPRTAQKMIYNAKKDIIKGETLVHALERQLIMYDALPIVRTPDGREFRRKNPSFVPRQRSGKTKKKKKGEDSSKDIFNQVRSVLGTYMADRLEGLDPIINERIWLEFNKQLNALLREFHGRIGRAARDGRETRTLFENISRRDLIEACHILRMDPPKSGQPVNLVIAKRQKRSLARVYHPDTNKGDHSMTKEYDEVVKAFDLIEQYNLKLGGEAEPNQVVS